MTIDYKRIGLLALLASTQAGCAGAEYNITANGAQYPISFSRGLPDHTGKTLVIGQGLDAAGPLDIDEMKLGFGYGLAVDNFDISNQVNRHVQAKGGAGVVELQLKATNCILNYLFPLTYLPFWPGCVSLKVTGEVVKLSKTAPPPAEPPVVSVPAKAPEEIAPAHSDPTGKEGAKE